MLLLQRGLPAVSLLSCTAEGISHTETHKHIERTLWKASSGNQSADTAADTMQMHNKHQYRRVRHRAIDLVIHTSLWHRGISGIVSFLGCLVAHCGATLGPSQDTECSVQPPEGAAPH